MKTNFKRAMKTIDKEARKYDHRLFAQDLSNGRTLFSDGCVILVIPTVDYECYKRELKTEIESFDLKETFLKIAKTEDSKTATYTSIVMDTGDRQLRLFKEKEKSGDIIAINQTYLDCVADCGYSFAKPCSKGSKAPIYEAVLNGNEIFNGYAILPVCHHADSVLSELLA